MVNYWNPGGQRQQIYPQTQSGQSFYPTQSFQPYVPQTPPGSTGGMIPPTGGVYTPASRREESYIENILRLNIGKLGTFYFTIPSAEGINTQGNTRVIRGYVVQAGRDHAVLREQSTNHYFLFPMIYFDYAEFDEQLVYLNQAPGSL